MTRERVAAPQSRTEAFSAGATRLAYDPSRGPEFARLTYAGQMLYADLRKDGHDHDVALRESRYQHGTRRGKVPADSA